MVFRRFVEVGRVIVINYGPLTGKLAVIVDILTTTKVIVQGLKGGVRRQELSLRRVTLTDDKINIKRGAKREEVLKAIQKRAVLRHMATKGKKGGKKPAKEQKSKKK